MKKRTADAASPRITVRITPKIRKFLEMKAKEDERSISAVVVRTLRELAAAK